MRGLHGVTWIFAAWLSIAANATAQPPAPSAEPALPPPPVPTGEPAAPRSQALPRSVPPATQAQPPATTPPDAEAAPTPPPAAPAIAAPTPATEAELQPGPRSDGTAPAPPAETADTARPAAPAAPPRFFGRDTETPPVDESHRRVHYGGSLMIADATAGMLMAGGLLFGLACFANTFTRHEDHWTCPVGAGSAVLGLATFVIVPPVLHITRERPGAAAGSFALRLGLPALSLALAMQSDAGGLASLIFIGGVVTTLLVDWYILAYQDVEPRDRATRVRPIVLADEHTLGLGLRGEL